MRAFVTEPAKLGECPVWDALASRLYWIDVTGKQICSCDENGGDITRVEVEDFPGSIALRQSGGLVVGFRRGVALLDAGLQQVAYQPLPDEIVAKERFNDGACDKRGRFFVGTMDKLMSGTVGGLYRVDSDLSMQKVTEGIGISNGIAWSPDDKRLFHCDSAPPHVYVHDYDISTGEVENRRVFIALDPDEGKPDGCAMDAEGCLWLAAPGSGNILRFDPDGQLMLRLKTPVIYPSCVSFGGKSKQTLFITSLQPFEGGIQPLDGAIFVHETDVEGVETGMFGG